MAAVAASFTPLVSASHVNPRPRGISTTQRCRNVAPRPLPVLEFSDSAQVRVREFSRLVPSFARGGKGAAAEAEEVFFDGGAHYGDMIANLIFGLTLVWLPLALASISRSLFVRYRFTNLRVTLRSGLLGEDRKDFSYEVVKEARYVPRFIGEWGDIAIELKDGTIMDLRSVPKFREVTDFVNERAGKKLADPSVLTGTASPASKKGFSS